MAHPGREKKHKADHGQSFQAKVRGRISKKQGQCRIIGGRWRGRKIHFDDAEGLRPTTDRVRETVFNWLQPYISQSNCLDAFSGSGALGFEALSRGAARVVLVEKNSSAYRNIEANIRALSGEPKETTAGGSTVNTIVPVHADVIQWLQTAGEAGFGPFDLVFLDPPYQQTGLLADVAITLDQSGCLAEDAIIYVEHAFGEAVTFPASWQCIKDKHTPQIAYKLFNRRKDEVKRT